MAKVWIRHYAVKPTARFYSFPLDMIRYDSSLIATEEDARKIQASFRRGEAGRSDWVEQTEIQLYHIGQKDWTPTRARWESFGWKVVEGSLETAREF